MNVGAHMAACFSLPVRIGYRTLAAAGVLKVPAPCLGVDGLTHRTQDPQRGKIVVLDGRRVKAHQCPHRRGCCVELRHAVLLDHVPVSVGVGVGWNALKHDRGGAVAQWAVDLPVQQRLISHYISA